MISKEIISVKFDEFAMNYSINLTEEYITFVVKQLNAKGFTDEDFVTSIDRIMETNTSMFGKMPNLAMFLENSDKRTEDKEKLARQQAVNVIAFAKGYSISNRCLFDNATTNAVVQDIYGGHRAIMWLLSDNNDKKKDTDWFKKQFIDNWLDYRDMGKESFRPCVSDSGHSNGVLYVGDRNKIQEIENKQALIEN